MIFKDDGDEDDGDDEDDDEDDDDDFVCICAPLGTQDQRCKLELQL